MILLIDHQDSFTYNLYHLIGKVTGRAPLIKNKNFSIQELKEIQPSQIILGPGPGHPTEGWDSSLELLKQIFLGQLAIPTLGICLGMQMIAHIWGGKVLPGRGQFHGITSPIYHNRQGSWSSLTIPFLGGRYHSLIVEKLPQDLAVTAWSQDPHGITPMGIKSLSRPVEGWQFHPESFLTTQGEIMLKSWLDSSSA